MHCFGFERLAIGFFHQVSYPCLSHLCFFRREPHATLFSCSHISLQDKPWSVLRIQLDLDITSEASRLMHVLMVNEDGRRILYGEIRRSLGAEDAQGPTPAWSMEWKSRFPARGASLLGILSHAEGNQVHQLFCTMYDLSHARSIVFAPFLGAPPRKLYHAANSDPSTASHFSQAQPSSPPLQGGSPPWRRKYADRPRAQTCPDEAKGRGNGAGSGRRLFRKNPPI